MHINLIDRNARGTSAEISEISKQKLEALTNWKFNWLELYQPNTSRIYQIKSDEVQGLIKIEFVDPDFFEMKNIETSPSNYGSNGKYKNTAQVLIAYACLLSFELNKGPYKGYLSFVSKGNHIDFYK